MWFSSKPLFLFESFIGFLTTVYHMQTSCMGLKDFLQLYILQLQVSLEVHSYVLMWYVIDLSMGDLISNLFIVEGFLKSYRNVVPLSFHHRLLLSWWGPILLNDIFKINGNIIKT